MMLKKARSDVERLTTEVESIRQNLAAKEAELEEARVAVRWLERQESEPHEERVEREEKADPKTDVIFSNPGAGKTGKMWDHMLDTLRSAFQGKSLSDASIALLSVVGEPLSEREIVDALLAGGVTMVSAKPVTNLRFALARKSKETNAIVPLPLGRWGLSQWVDQDGVVHAKPSPVAMDDVHNDHLERSRKGLQAARDRGVKLGRPDYYPPEVREEAFSMADRGVSVSEIREKIGVTGVTIRRWLRHRAAEQHATEGENRNPEAT